MAAKKTSVLSELREITECCICTDTFTDARMLPCIHSFCLKCIEETGSQTKKKPGDQMPCPLCRKEFIIPTKGWMDIQKNFFIDRLIEVTKNQKVCDVGLADTLCDVCKSDEATHTSSATMYCIECRGNLCENCVKEHDRNKFCRNHRVVPVGSEIEDKNKVTGFCDQHPKEELKVFCFDCKTVVCLLCFIESHQSHKGSDVTKVVDEFKKQISADINNVFEFSTASVNKKDQLEKKRMDFIQTIQTVETEIFGRSQELKQMLDKHTKSLLDELIGIKDKRLKEMETQKEEMDRHLVIMDSFKMYCNELKSKGSPVDICRTVNDLHLRADELKRLHESQMQIELPKFTVHFEKTELENVHSITNIVGKITDISVELIGRIDLRGIAFGITKLQNNIYVLIEMPKLIQVFNDQNPFVLQKEINIEEIGNPWDIGSCEKQQCLYITDDYINKCIWKMKTTDDLVTKWLPGIDNSWTLSVCDDGHVLISRNTEPCNLEMYAPDASLSRRILLSEDICDLKHAVMTSRGSFVILHQWKENGKWEVSKVNGDGQIHLNSFNPDDQSHQLNYPRYLSLDSDDRVFVADSDNNQVILLDSDLKLVAVLLNQEKDEINWPLRLFHDKKKNEILVSSVGTKGVFIFRL